ncbi:MAG TPA: hypothetical protein VK324_05600 [Tepidisphaeraceae bacterium]|nr:hypothetical protein [Tepidisphaeraceae bacterium]
MDDAETVLIAFEHVAVSGDPNCARLSDVVFNGFTPGTLAGRTDGGRLYGSLRRHMTGPRTDAIELLVYADPCRTSDKLLCRGSVPRAGRFMVLADASGAGIAGTAWVDACVCDYDGLVFVLDPDAEQSR